MKQLVRTALYTSKSERIGRFVRLSAYYSRGPLRRLAGYGAWAAVWYAVITAAYHIGMAVGTSTGDKDAAGVAALLSAVGMVFGVFLIKGVAEKVLFVWRLAAANDVKEE